MAKLAVLGRPPEQLAKRRPRRDGGVGYCDLLPVGQGLGRDQGEAVLRACPAEGARPQEQDQGAGLPARPPGQQGGRGLHRPLPAEGGRRLVRAGLCSVSAHLCWQVRARAGGGEHPGHRPVLP